MAKRFKQQDWLDLGLQALAEDGPAGLTIDALCVRSGKTKGSFYSHFVSAAEFNLKLAHYWQQCNTESLITNVEAAPKAEKRSTLDQLALGLDQDVEKQMRRLAANDEAVAETVRNVDRQRIDFMADLYQETGKFDADDSLALAKMEYALLVMYQTGVAGYTRGELADSYQRYLRIVGM